MRRSLVAPGVTLLVAVDGDELTGYVGCGFSRDLDPAPGAGEIWALFVAVSRWRSGAGRALIAAALDDLSRRAYAHVTVWSFAANARANAFYEAQGFTRDGAQRTEAAWADIPEVRYGRPLI